MIETKAVKEFLKIFELYYNDIDNLCKRLQDDYNDEISFVADEQDRLALCGVLDAFDEINKENEINSSIEARAKMEDDYDKWIEEK